MMSIKHTPGPWAWRRTHGSRDGVELVHQGHGLLLVMDAVRHGMSGADLRFAVRSDSMGGIMVKATGLFPESREDYHDINSPDARLIAAAPDLLDACEALLREMDWLVEMGKIEPFHQTQDAARSAIAKARGVA